MFVCEAVEFQLKVENDGTFKFTQSFRTCWNVCLKGGLMGIDGGSLPDDVTLYNSLRVFLKQTFLLPVDVVGLNRQRAPCLLLCFSIV